MIVRYILTLVLIFGIIFGAQATQFERSYVYDPTRSMLSQLTSSNHIVIIGDIVSFSRHHSTAKYQLWSDTFTVFHIAGHVITENGKEKMNGKYWFRWGDMDDTSAQNQVDLNTGNQLFIFKDGRRFYDFRIHLDNGILKMSGGTPLVGVVDGSFVPAVTGKNRNCGVSFRDHPAYAVKNENKIPQHDNAQKNIDVLLRQTCIDGKLHRSRNKKKGLTEEEFILSVVTYMQETSSTVKMPATDISPKDNGPSSSRLRVNKHHRDYMALILDTNEKWLELMEKSDILDEMKESSRAHVAFAVERADFLGIPYSDRLNEFRDAYFEDYPRPSHAQKRQRTEGKMKRFPEIRNRKSSRRLP